MHWTNAIGSLAILVLAAYLWRHAGEQAEDEAVAFGGGRRWTRFRAVNLKGGAAFLGVMALALLVAGFR